MGKTKGKRRILSSDLCPDKDLHTPCPVGYTQWHEWADKMSKTHEQVRCPSCGLFTIWKRKEKPVATTKKPKGSWTVRMRCTVTKDVICENCTEEEARTDPFEHAVDEMEIDQRDYEVTDVRENR